MVNIVLPLTVTYGLNLIALILLSGYMLFYKMITYFTAIVCPAVFFETCIITENYRCPATIFVEN